MLQHSQQNPIHAIRIVICNEFANKRNYQRLNWIIRILTSFGSVLYTLHNKP